MSLWDRCLTIKTKINRLIPKERRDYWKAVFLLFIWKHNLSVIVISGAAAAMLISIMIWRGCKASPESYFPRKQSDFLTEKKLNRNLAELESSLKNKPGDIRLLFNKGLLIFQKGENYYPEAIVALEKARSSGVMDARIFYYLGFMYQQKGLYNYAELEYKRFLFNYPDDYDASMLLGKALYSQKKYQEASNIYSELLKKHKKDTILLTNAVFALWKSGQDYSETLKRLKKSSREGKYLALTAEGEILLEDGKLEESASALEQAENTFKFSRNDVNLHILKFRHAIKTKDLAKAKELIGHLVQNFPDCAEIPMLKMNLSDLEKEITRTEAKKTAKNKTRSPKNR